MRMLCKNAILPASLVALGISLTPASSQTPFEARINTRHGPVTVTANLPAGWTEASVALASFDGVTLALPEDGWRVVHLGFGHWAHERLSHRQSSVRGFRPGGAPIESRRVTLGGQPGTSYLGFTPAGGIAAEAPGHDRVMVTGPQMLVHFDGCHGDRPDPVLLTVISGGAPFVELSDDPHLAALFAELSIELPPGAEPCPPDLAARLDAVPAPILQDGWSGRERFGLSIWLPEDFRIAADGWRFVAIHPDLDHPQRDGFFGVNLERLDARDAWQDEAPSDATITPLPDQDLGPAGSFEHVSVTYMLEGHAGSGTILIAREPDADQRFLVLRLVAMGLPEHGPWLGLQALHDEIIARLGQP